jgi:hypothetical protein
MSKVSNCGHGNRVRGPQASNTPWTVGREGSDHCPRHDTSAGPVAPPVVAQDGGPVGPVGPVGAGGEPVAGADLVAVFGSAFDRMRSDIEAAYDREIAEGGRVAGRVSAR